MYNDAEFRKASQLTSLVVALWGEHPPVTRKNFQYSLVTVLDALIDARNNAGTYRELTLDHHDLETTMRKMEKDTKQVMILNATLMAKIVVLEAPMKKAIDKTLDEKDK